MKTSAELMNCVAQSKAWMDKVASTREAYYAGRISADEYVNVLDECDAFMENMKRSLQ